MKHLFLITVAFVALVARLPAADLSVNLELLPIFTATNQVQRYEIHFGRAQRTNRNPEINRTYQFTNVLPAGKLSTTISNLAPGIWYFSCLGYLTNGLQSMYCTNEVAWTNREFAPELKLTGPADALILQGAANGSSFWKTLAVITSTNSPLQLTAERSAMFRAIATNIPPPFPQ